MKKIELLAPAGSYEKAVVAFLYGADAIYVGAPNVSLRTRAKIENEDLKKIIEYAKKINKKVYVAINIYANDYVYEDIIKEVKFLKDLNVDGIIASDGGVIDIIRKYAPDTPINISTQANTISVHTCEFWKRNGAKRIIMGREMSKQELKVVMENKPEDLEIEIFVHGAICFAYSGRCFLSEYMSGRDANKGDCAQCCRWNYNMYVEDRSNPGEFMPVEEDINGTTIFSSKDLCLLEEIPEIIEMGIDSIKIEGRLKTEYYLASVINTYRCLIDEYYEKREQKKEDIKIDFEKYRKEIEKVKTRNLTKFNFNQKEDVSVYDIQDVKGRQYNQNYEYAGIIEDVLENNMIKVEIKNKLQKGDKLEIIVPRKINPIEFEINEMVDVDTLEKIDQINPGKKEQMVLIKVEVETEDKEKMGLKKGFVIRKKKN